jgi:hypothetical protein
MDKVKARLDKLGLNVPTAGSIKDWDRDDIFYLDNLQETNIKKALAHHLQCQYDTVQHDQAGVAHPIAEVVDKVDPYDPEKIRAEHKKFMDIGKNAKSQTAFDNALRERQDSGSVSTVINACLVDWLPPGKKYDIGYIGHFRHDKLPEWSTHIERTAGGLQHEIRYNAQHLAVTNMSSLMAMISEVVYQFLSEGKVSPDMARAFRSIRVLLLYGASKDDISTIINEKENYEQEKRKKTSEPDVISVVMQWGRNMESVSGGKLKPDNALDYLKYGVQLGDPRSAVHPLLKALLDKKKLPPTTKNKIAVLTAPEINAKYMQSNKFTTGHPMLQTYSEIACRVRFRKGFNDEAMEKIYTFKKEWGRRGWADKPLPLTRKLLMDERILTSNGLTGTAKESVPEWRDGERGRKLQLAMLDDAHERCFDLQVHTGELFKDGETWAHYSRLKPMIFLALNLEHGDPTGWPPLIVNFWSEIRKGQYDAEILSVSQLLPPTVDSQVAGQQAAMITNVFKTLRAKSLSLKQLASMSVLSPPVDETPASRTLDDDEEKKSQEQMEFTGVPAEVGASADVTRDIDKNYGTANQMTLQEKENMVKELNAQELKRRDEEAEGRIMKAAAEVWRFSVKVVPDVDAAVSYMQSASHGGLQARVCVADLTMAASCQTAAKSRKLVKEPSEEAQKKMAEQIKMIPKTPIIGHALIRLSTCDGYTLMKSMSGMLPHKRTFLVPIAVPGMFQRTLKSGASRSTGASDEMQDRSGVSFIMRTIGHAPGQRENMKRRKAVVGDAEVDDAEADDTDGSGDGADIGETLDEFDDEAAGAVASKVEHGDVHLLPVGNLKSIFGSRAPDAQQVLFQHTSNITAEAAFANKQMRVMVSKNARSEPTPYRKGQVHPTVFHEVHRSALRCANVPLSGRECCVVVTGGTPDSVVGALMAGYRYVVFVANNTEEETMMELPTAAELEDAHVDLTKYLVIRVIIVVIMIETQQHRKTERHFLAS